FHPIPGRTFRTLSVDFLDGDDFSMLLEGYGCFDPSSDENIVRDAIVRVRYRATEEQARHIDHAAIVRALEQAGAHRVYAIQPEIIREDRRRVEGLDETLSPLQALDMWVESHSPSVPADALRDRTAAY